MSAAGKTFIRRRGTTAVPNSTVHDDRISLQALGILVVVLGRPPRKAGNGYRAFVGRGMGQAAILSAFKQLEDAGYRHQFQRREGGRMVTDTVWSETPIDPQTAAAWHAQEVEAFEGRGKAVKARRPKASTVREISRTAQCVESHAHTVRDSPRTETHAPLLRKDQGSPTHYVRNGEPGISNAHEDDHPATSTAEAVTAPPSGPQASEAPQDNDDPQSAPEGPQGIEAWHEIKKQLHAQREERRAREAAEARYGRLTEPTDHRHPRPRTGVRA